jgi:hypothetical protein
MLLLKVDKIQIPTTFHLNQIDALRFTCQAKKRSIVRFSTWFVHQERLVLMHIKSKGQKSR